MLLLRPRRNQYERPGMSNRVILCQLLLVILIPLAPSPVTASPRHVLLVNSYDQRMSWVQDIVQAVTDSMGGSPNNISIHVENLDAKIHHEPEYFAKVRDLFAFKYRNQPLDLIMCSDNYAFDFLKQFRQELFGPVPVVFCGLNNYQPEVLAGFAGVTGAAEVISPRETVAVMRRNHPGLKQIYIINDFLLTGRNWQATIRQELAGLPQDIQVTYAPNLSLAEHKAAIAALPADAAVLLGVFFSDRGGKHSTYEETGAELSRDCPVPFYCLLQFNLRAGAIGGRVIGGYQQGAAMAQLAQRVLAGEDPAQIPVVSNEANAYIFDYPALEKWGIDIDDLPPHSIVVNRPETIWQNYRTEVITGSLVGGLLFVVILVLATNIRRRKTAERHLRKSQEKLAVTLNSIGDAVITTDSQGNIFGMNDQAAALCGWSEMDAVGQQFGVAVPLREPDTRMPLPDLAQHVLAERKVINKPEAMLLVTRDGREILVADSGAPILARNGTVEGAVLVLRDVTEQVALAERLRQSQKMESIGQLAGGVAHDFNNMLAGILGYADLLREDLTEHAALQVHVDSIITAGHRAADLVQKLLSFSRKGDLEQGPVDVHALIHEVESLLARSIDRRIRLQVELVATSHIVCGDATQLQQALLNLALNARDAMGTTGELGLRSCNVKLDQKFCDRCEMTVEPGDYIELAVSDTGCGIPPQALELIFEPFFTTKPVGQGTGLGLAAVHGTVRQHQGAVLVSSQVGHGTTFRIFLPLTSLPAVKPIATDQCPPPGTGLILVIDDEEMIRNLIRQQLESLGYTVLLAADGVEGIRMFEQHQNLISLVLLDRVMPKLNGRDCFRAIRKIDPNACVIIASGYAADQSIDELFAEGLTSFIKKPYSLARLGRTINEVLRKNVRAHH